MYLRSLYLVSFLAKSPMSSTIDWCCEDGVLCIGEVCSLSGIGLVLRKLDLRNMSVWVVCSLEMEVVEWCLLLRDLFGL